MQQHPKPGMSESQHYIDPAAPGASAPHFGANRASGAHSSARRPPQEPAPTVAFPLPELNAGSLPAEIGLEKLQDVELDVTIELGRAEMELADVARLQPGMVVPLDALVGDLVDVMVNGRLIARGEVVVVDDYFCVRVVELIDNREAA
jgi:flagellar motor switch protein FliN